MTKPRYETPKLLNFEETKQALWKYSSKIKHLPIDDPAHELSKVISVLQGYENSLDGRMFNYIDIINNETDLLVKIYLRIASIYKHHEDKMVKLKANSDTSSTDIRIAINERTYWINFTLKWRNVLIGKIARNGFPIVNDTFF